MLPIAFATLVFSFEAGAAVVNPFEELDEEKAFRLEEDLVTVASRYAQAARQAPSIVTVVTDREIRERGFLTLADLLRSLPGVYLSMSPESRSIAWFRGVISADNNKILLLVDGVPWYDGIYTHAWIDAYIPLENVKQVEIIKGPGSAIYGTNAFAGVVNVVTYKGEDLVGGFGRLQGGTGSRRGAAIVVGDTLGRQGGVQVSGMLRFLDEDGDGLDISPENRRNINGLDPKRALNSALRLEIGRFSLGIDTVDYRHTYFVNEQDSVQGVLLESADTFNLGYHNQFISAKYRQPLGQAVELAPYLHLQHYDNPGSYGWFSDFPVTSGDDGSMTATWKSTLVETSKESFHVLGGTDVQARLGSSHLLLGGLGIDNNRILALEDLVFASGSTEPDSSRFHLSESEGHDIVDVFAFLQETWSATWWLEATGGLRADYHSLSGPFLSPRAGLLFIPSSTATVKLLYGSAFRAPNARELLVEVGRRDSGENYFTSGNPDLVHERIDTVEAEVLGDLTRWLKLRGGLFFSQTTNEIDKYTETRSTAWGRLGNSYYKNYGGSDALGAEVESVIRFDIGEFGVSYVYTRARDKSTGHAQYEFPPHMAHFRGTARPAEGLRVSLLGDWYGTRPRSDWTPDSKRPDGPSFLLLHAAAATDLLAHGRLRADLSIRNLLDTNYETLVYRDQANEVESDGSPSNPRDLQGDGRAIVIGLETQF